MIDPDQFWLNEPAWSLDGGVLSVQTTGGTDYWQRTHYGFRRDNAHALVRRVRGDVVIRARFRFAPNAQYDQCGILVRRDESNWFKCSIEYEDPSLSRLGSVVTSAGYSDWATRDISSQIREMRYEVEVKHGDITARSSEDGTHFDQMRIAHLHGTSDHLMVGIYGCSPTGSGFSFEVLDLNIRELVDVPATAT